MELQFNLEYYPEISSSIISEAVKKIEQNQKKWANPFFKDVFDHSDLKKFEEVCRPFMNNENLENLIVLGTGGSIQTIMALEGLLNLKLYPVTSSRPRELVKVLTQCSPDNSIVIPVSRGGKTLDVNSTIEVFKDYPMIGLSSQGPMNEYLKTKDIPILPVPDLSGRFAASISSVALIPAMLGGIDINEFLNSLDFAYKEFQDLKKIDNNFALQFAVFLMLIYKNNNRNVFNMPYSSFLEGSVGLFVQEISESTGKDGKGLLGTAQSAPLCQHSVLELLLGGSKGHTVPIVWTTKNEPEDIEINNPIFGLKKKTALEIINHQADATFQALLEQNIPAGKIELKKVDIVGLAHLIAFIQNTVYYLCMLLDVNWESNPLVITGKKICNDALEKNLSTLQRLENRKKIIETKFINFDFKI